MLQPRGDVHGQVDLFAQVQYRRDLVGTLQVSKDYIVKIPLRCCWIHKQFGRGVWLRGDSGGLVGEHVGTS
jgi:hypothetical protein